ncbi:MAG: hypothetical protein H9W81_13850 [Enterococcus sp.]|nr:hypothetical protein [Enterococcus sp.]
MERFYGIVEKDNSTGGIIRKHVFRDRELATRTFEKLKPSVKRKQSLQLFSRPAGKTRVQEFAKIFETALGNGDWDEHWTVEEDFIPTHPVTIHNGDMLDLLSEQLEGVLKMALLADIDITALIDHTLTRNEALRENYQR